MPDVYLEQTIAQLNSIIAQTDGHTHVSDSLNACYEQLLMELGTSGSLFEKNFTTQGHLATDCWLKSAWKGCSVYGIDVALPHASHLQRQWEHDEFLMDLFLRQGPTDAYVKVLNHVRRHLHVYSLAEISTGNGRSVQTLFTRRSCLRRDAVVQSNLCWPVERPTAKDFGIWLTYINARYRRLLLLGVPLASTSYSALRRRGRDTICG